MTTQACRHLVQLIARLQLSSEQHPDNGNDDAIDTLDSLITTARQITNAE